MKKTQPHMIPSHYEVIGDMDHATTHHRTAKGAVREINRRFSVGTKQVQLTVDRTSWSRKLLIAFEFPDVLPTDTIILLRELDWSHQWEN